jgi:hypothetical protein
VDKDFTATVTYEVTDTFGGEANYSWVNRKSEVVPYGIKNREIVRRLKEFAGLTGIRGKTVDMGDIIQFRPYKICMVAYAIWEE